MSLALRRMNLPRIGFLLAGGLVLSVAGSFPASATVPRFEDYLKRLRGSELTVTDRRGILLQELRIDPTRRQLAWTRIDEVSPALRSAVLFAEDRRFGEHGGVDWLALARAGVGSVFGDKKRGASTISMQVATWVFSLSPTRRRGRRNWIEKIEQVRDARELESVWTKDQILEVYLNSVDFRGETRGIGAAARLYFGKSPLALGHEESALLAASIREPSAPRERIERRACEILSAGANRPCAELAPTSDLYFSARRFDPSPRDHAPHFARNLRANRAETFRSSLDAGAQIRVNEILRNQLATIRDRGVRDAAALVADHRTGEILAYVGGVGKTSSAPFVDGVRGRRQAGSTLKPFFYTSAFDRKLLTPGSWLEDRPLGVAVSGGIYQPSNHDGIFRGWVRASDALASSLNIPAVRVVDFLGTDRAHALLLELGFAALRPAEEYGPSIALGAVDLTLYDLVTAYGAIATGGNLRFLSDRPGRTPVQRRVFTERAAAWTARILADRGERGRTFGLDNPLSQSFWAAAKTGTSKDMRDNWCVGFDDRYVVGVWVGNLGGSSMQDVTGVTGSAPAWAEIMRYLNRSRKSQVPAWVTKYPLPPGPALPVDRRRIRFSKIVAPLDGEWIARDPEIPEANQKLRVVVEGSDSDVGRVTWGEESCVPDRGTCRFSIPSPGEYAMQWRSGTGELRDEIRVTVRR